MGTRCVIILQSRKLYFTKLPILTFQKMKFIIGGHFDIYGGTVLTSAEMFRKATVIFAQKKSLRCIKIRLSHSPVVQNNSCFFAQTNIFSNRPKIDASEKKD